jgi:hypothetical protein
MIIKVSKDGKKFVNEDGTQFDSLQDLLEGTFKDQGEFYEKVFGVSYQEASDANWHPYDDDFSASICAGFDRFVKDKGVITKEKDLKTYITDELFEKEE